uniref:Uncharacterized protein n=1 Tax=Arundo donax TaxID=35708 RepID=A0A0A9E114_ARUDO
MKQNLSSTNTTKACRVYIRSTQHFCIRAAQQKLASSFAVTSNSTPVHRFFKQRTPRVPLCYAYSCSLGHNDSVKIMQLCHELRSDKHERNAGRHAINIHI